MRLQKNSIALILLLVLLSGCIFSGKKIEFDSEAEKLNSIYADSNLDALTIEKIESNELLSQTEQKAMKKKLSAVEKRFAEEQSELLTAAESEEKNALLALTQIHIDRVSYLKALVELKDKKELDKLSALIEAFDFNSFRDGVSCADFESPVLKPKRIAVHEKSLQLENKIDIFENSFKQFAGKELNELKPGFTGESIVWMVQSGEIIFESCSAITDSIEAISGLRDAAEEDNLCLAFEKLNESVSGLEETASGLSVLSDSLFIESLGLDKNSVSEGQKSLVLIASEFRGLTEQLESECR